MDDTRNQNNRANLNIKQERNLRYSVFIHPLHNKLRQFRNNKTMHE